LSKVLEREGFFDLGAVRVGEVWVQPVGGRDPSPIDRCFSFFNTDQHPISAEHLLEFVVEVSNFLF